MSDRRRNDRRVGAADRRWFYPPVLTNRGKKSLPFTEREPDFISKPSTITRVEELTSKQKGKA